MMSAPPEPSSIGGGIPIKCSDCEKETTMDQVVPHIESGKPICKQCAYDYIKTNGIKFNKEDMK